MMKQSDFMAITCQEKMSSCKIYVIAFAFGSQALGSKVEGDFYHAITDYSRSKSVAYL